MLVLCGERHFSADRTTNIHGANESAVRKFESPILSAGGPRTNSAPAWRHSYFGFGGILGLERPVGRACAIPTATTAFLVLLEAKIGGRAGDTAGTDETFPQTTRIGAFAAI